MAGKRVVLRGTRSWVPSSFSLDGRAHPYVRFFSAWTRAAASRLPMPRNAAMTFRYLACGFDFPCSHNYTDCPDAPTSIPNSSAESPSRFRLVAMPFARNRRPLASSSLSAPGPADAFSVPPPGAERDSAFCCFSSSTMRRLRLMISARCADAAFLSPSVSARTSFRATREISAFRTDAIFGMSGIVADNTPGR